MKKEKIFKIIKKYAIFHHDFEGEVSDQTTIQELGVDSLGWNEILILIEEELDVVIMVDDIDWQNIKTLGELCEDISSKL